MEIIKTIHETAPVKRGQVIVRNICNTGVDIEILIPTKSLRGNIRMRYNYTLHTKGGKEFAGAPYCKYSGGSADYTKFDIELGIPVSEPLPEQGGFYMTKTCEGKAITATHKGAYKDIEKTYAPMMQYLSENDLESTGVYYDYYLNNPADTAENELLTKVVFPLK